MIGIILRNILSFLSFLVILLCLYNLYGSLVYKFELGTVKTSSTNVQSKPVINRIFNNAEHKEDILVVNNTRRTKQQVKKLCIYIFLNYIF